MCSSLRGSTAEAARPAVQLAVQGCAESGGCGTVDLTTDPQDGHALFTVVQRHGKGTAQSRWAPRCLRARFVRQFKPPTVTAYASDRPERSPRPGHAGCLKVGSALDPPTVLVKHSSHWLLQVCGLLRTFCRNVLDTHQPAGPPALRRGAVCSSNGVSNRPL